MNPDRNHMILACSDVRHNRDKIVAYLVREREDTSRFVAFVAVMGNKTEEALQVARSIAAEPFRAGIERGAVDLRGIRFQGTIPNPSEILQLLGSIQRSRLAVREIGERVPPPRNHA